MNYYNLVRLQVGRINKIISRRRIDVKQLAQASQALSAITECFLTEDGE